MLRPTSRACAAGLDWVLTHLAVQRAPMVLVLDDAHWADPESLSWLAAFAPRAEELPLLLVVGYRPDELPDHAESFRVLPGRAGQRPVDLEPLSAAAVARLVREDLGAQADDAFCRECWAVTAGNPFEAVELTAKVRDRGLVPTEAGAHLLRDLAAAVKGSGLIARLERLGTSTVRFAWACAVLGTEIPRPWPRPSPDSAPRRPPTRRTPCAAPGSSPAPTPWSSCTHWSPPPSTAPSPAASAWPCTARPRGV